MGRLLGRFALIAVILGALNIVRSCIRSFDPPERYEPQTRTQPVESQTRTMPRELKNLESRGYDFQWDTDMEGFDGAWVDYSVRDGWMLTYYPEVDGVSFLLDLNVDDVDNAATAHSDFIFEFGIDHEMILDLGDGAVSRNQASDCHRGWCCEASFEDGTIIWACVPD